MSAAVQGTRVLHPNRAVNRLGVLVLLSSSLAALAADLTELCADRAAIERVYYHHRLGEKPPFEEVLPPATLEKLVRQDLRKEAALKNFYALEITPAQLDAEVQRINTTTRAPEILAEIKTTLSNDLTRFARAMAKPILVERLLREKFDNDDALHAPERRQVEQTRQELLAAKTNGATFDKLLLVLKRRHSNQVSELNWQLGARPEEIPGAPKPDDIEIKKRFGSNAQILSAPRAGEKEMTLYFTDLPGELQNVLRAQLRQASDVSAVIEMPNGFLLYVVRAKTAAALSVAMLSVPKRSYEAWLEQQKE
jgi:hypothetical protein